jgi:hypothetical protein
MFSFRAGFLAFGAVSLMLSASARADVVVYPSGDTPYGNTNVLANQWWQYAFSVPVNQSPFFDSTGANANVNNNGPVFFLSGIFGVFEPGFPGTVGSASRSVTVASGKPLFFPVLNIENDNVGNGVPGFNMLQTQAQLRALNASTVATYTGLYATIDGKNINLGGPNYLNSPYRDISPNPFDITLPPNIDPSTLNENLYEFFYDPPLPVPGGVYAANAPAYPNGTVANGFTNGAVQDGIYLLVSGLSPGHHLITFGGENINPIDPTQDFKLDIVYDVNVTVPEPATLALWGIGLGSVLVVGRWRRKGVAKTTI